MKENWKKKGCYLLARSGAGQIYPASGFTRVYTTYSAPALCSFIHSNITDRHFSVTVQCRVYMAATLKQK
jgi:hypothetical protein